MVIGNNSKLPITHIGDVVFSLEERNHDLAPHGVYVTPRMRNNLLLVSYLGFA